MPICLRIERQGNVRLYRKPEGPVTIGRTVGKSSVDLDLGEDQFVSRRHARIWQEDGVHWIQDIGSLRGTWVDGVDIKGAEARPLGAGACVLVGETSLCLVEPDAVPEAEFESGQTGAATGGEVRPSTASGPVIEAAGVTLVQRIAGVGSGVLEDEGRSTALERQLDALCDLALRLGAEREMKPLLQIVVEQISQIIPEAQRCAVLMLERGAQRLMLKAQAPSEYRPSERLARQAMESGEGFAWIRSNISRLSEYSDIGNGMCVPLLVAGAPIGALCVDAPCSAPPFSDGALRALRTVGQIFCMAVEQHEARVLLARQAEFTHRLFCSRFPEKVRHSLLVEASQGTLPIGTRRSFVTVLQSDIRGFTRLSEELGPQRLTDLLNAYFPALIDAVFAWGGSVERLVGDAIFAVFGSPEPDPEQQEHAVRAALAMQEAAAEVSAFRSKRRHPTCGIGIGIDTGEVLHGFIGNAESIEFAVIGDAANYCSRYCAGAAPGEILISPEVHSHVWKLVQTEARIVQAKHEGEIEAHLVKGFR